MFAVQWQGLVDEVVVVDDHITGVVSEHQAGKVIGWPPSGIRIKGHRSTPGRYFREVRIRHALELMRNARMPVHEAALAAGFSTQPVFSRACRQHFG